MNEIKYATFWQRLAALVIDGLLYFGIALIVSLWKPLGVWLSTSPWHASFYLLVVYLGYFVFLQQKFGLTPGKRLLKIRMVTVDGDKPKMWVLTLRETLLKFISFLPAYLGFVAMFLNDEGITWHDKLAKTKVVSERSRGHKRSVIGFYLTTLLILLISAYQTYVTINKIVNRQSDVKPCKFATISEPIKTNHFDFYVEDPQLENQVKAESQIFERAFDYVFWSISGIKEKVSRSTICIYTKKDSFNFSVVMDGTGSWASAYFDSSNNVFSFGPDYWKMDRQNLFGNDWGLGEYIYHEITHYAIDNYFYQNQGRVYMDTWLNEGLAQHFSIKCNTKINRLMTSVNNKSWDTMGQPYYIDDKYTIYNYYQQSCLMTEFLIDKYGSDLPKKIIEDEVANNEMTEVAISKATGKSYTELNKEWRQWLNGKI